MFPIEPLAVLTELQVFGAYATSLDGHNSHRLSAELRCLTGITGGPPTQGVPKTGELTDLRRKLATLPAIEQAKGMLMGNYGISADAAFEVLRRWSMSNNLKLNTLCATLVVEASQPSELPFESLHKALARWSATR